MADDISIFVKVVGQKDIVATTNSLNKLEAGVKRLSSDLSKGRIDSNQYTTGLRELRKGVDGSFTSWQKAKSAVDQYSKQVQQAQAIQKQAQAAIRAEAQALKDYRQARREATAENQRFDAEQQKSIRTAREAANANRRLRMEFREGYAAKVQLRAAQMRLSQAFRQGIVDSDQYEAQLQQLTLAQKNLGNAAMAGGRKMSGTGMAIQQTGYQVGDFLVQVQGGTNFLVAFGQQATQLVGILPMVASNLGLSMKAAIGLSAGLGIAIPLITAIGAYFMRTRAAAKEAAEGVNTLEDSIKSLDQSLKDWLQTKKASQLGITVEELLGTQNISEAEAELNSAREALERLITSSSVTPTGIFAGVAIIDFIKQKLATNEVTAAVLRLAQAEETLGLLRQKQGEERFSNYAEERVALQDQLAMAQEIARFGEDSAQVAKLELEQRITAFNRNIDQQVASNNLNAIHARTLKAINAELANTEFATEEIARNQEVLKEGAQGFLNIWTAITGQIKESSSSMQAAQRAIEVGKVADQYAQYGAGRAAFEGIVQGGLGDTTGGVKPPSTPSSRQQGGTASIKDPLPELLKRLALDERLLGVSKEREAVERAIADSDVTYSQASVDAAVKRLEAYNLEKQALEEVAATQEKIASILESSMESAFMSMVDGTKSVKDAFKSMAAEIIKELYRVLVVQQIVNSAKTAMGGFFADGAAFSGGRVTPFANGGVVGSPTYFPMSGGKTGLMGEAGPEAIMPLKRGANGKLGVSVEGGSGSVVVNNNINVTGGSDPAAIRMEVAKLMPQITSATKSAVIDARRRGGQMKATFG